ncbi:undecaprenyl-phosphate glucose phosphotransferase [Pseudoxanthomonas suwonensis]|uniref:undecaprenyl-phosphate glucose phosphotransferase n=1 Tax=Pseudoxanthomonas suwonensis TaxID=314722 RepID=UPI00048C5262|nr:undecaprenyl-phosphate glucose phosphotransferase [Pseudoxanthomonas suwonensis]
MLLSPLRPATEVRPDSANNFTAAFGAILRFGDPILLIAGTLLAHLLRFGTLAHARDEIGVVVVAVLTALIVFNTSPLYRSWRGRGLTAEAFQVGLQWSVVFTGVLVYTTALQLSDDLSRLWLASWFALSLTAAIGLRIVVRGGAAWVRSRGMDQRTAVIVGANPDAQRIVDALQSSPWAGIRVAGWFATHADRSTINGVPLLGRLDALEGYVASRQVDQVWIALPMKEQSKISFALNQLQHSTADIKFVPDLFGMHLLNHSVEQIAGLPVINLQQTPLQGPARILKAIEDRVLAAAILLAISPLMIAIAVAVKLSSPGPVFYRQERMSWNNKTFWMLKFRSMPVDAETSTGAVWAKAGENRATRVGSFLRKTSLDELPQFINVLKGDMSIVGPRPERPVFVDKFKHEIPAYMKKHMVKAGITGWAQVNGWRGSTDLNKRIECDLYYIENWSLAFDLKIIFMTLFKGFVHKNAY